MMKYRFELLVLVLLFLGSCKSSYEIPEKNEIPSAFEIEGDSSNNLANQSWEQFFEDSRLKNLINLALEKNFDLLKTMEKIRIANAQMRMGKMGMLPQINGVLGASQKKFGKYTMDGVGNYDTNFSTNIGEDEKIPDPYRDFSVGAQFSWEIDIWGKYSNRKKASIARWMATQQAANLVQTQLVAQVAKLYYQLVGLDEEIIILKKNISYQQVAFGLSKDLKESGKETQLAVDQFEALLLHSKSLLKEKERELKATELTLKGLLGDYQVNLQRTTLSEVNFEPEIVQIGVPANLLIRRPDILQAESELQAFHADVGEARAAFFPAVRLFGGAGFNAFDFSKLFLTPGSTVYELGAGLTAPIFNRGRIKANFEQAKASQQIAWLDYEKTVFNAYLEVLQVVNAYSTLDEQLEFKTEEVLVLRRSISNANTMFSVGYANYLDVINSQNRALEAELDYVSLKTQQLESIVSLYKSLGGASQLVEQGE